MAGVVLGGTPRAQRARHVGVAVEDELDARAARGVEGVVDGHAIVVGRPALLADWSMHLPPRLDAARRRTQLKEKGKTRSHKLIVKRLPAGSGVLDAVPKGKDYASAQQGKKKQVDIGAYCQAVRGATETFKEGHRATSTALFGARHVHAPHQLLGRAKRLWHLRCPSRECRC